MTATEDCKVSARPNDGHARLMQPAAHTTARGSLAVSAVALEVTLTAGYFRRFSNIRLINF